ncbi:response regulator receiver domain protein [Verrucomicrobiia bacterium DG1235]|nr:response regulator receiver domain protein [Verrucomicrobiae bacterium DG1235]
MENPITLLVVDDHPAFRAGLRSMLSEAPNLEVVAEAASVQETLDLHQQHAPDVTLLDLNLKKESGIDAITQLLAIKADTRVIVLSTFDMSEDIHLAFKAGARAYLLKDSSRSEIIQAIEAVYAGERVIPPAIKQRLLEQRSRPALTAKELEILELVVQGRRNKEIAADLGITEFTVKGHLKTVFLKLQVSDRTEAAIKAVSEGLVHLRP